MTRWSLGLADSHDSCVCLLDGDRIAAAIPVERLVRVKRAVVTEDLDYNQEKRVRAGYLEAIRVCCEIAGIQPAAVDQIAVASPDSRDANDIELTTALLSATLPAARRFPMPHPEHHLAHAYSAFFCSGFESAAALVADSFGTPVDGRREEHTGLHFRSADTIPEVVFKHLKADTAIVPRPTDAGTGWTLDREQISGIGEIYRLVTILLGFFQPSTKFDDAGKTMGLAPYGKLLSQEPVLMQPAADGTIDCSNAFEFFEALNLITRTDEGLCLSVRGPASPLSRFHKDLAAQVQWELEGATVHLARHLRERTGAARLVLAGGVFLNAVANRRIVDECGFDEVYAFPAATDDGTAVGAAYYAYQQGCSTAGRSPNTRALRRMGLGRSYDAETIGRELARWPVQFERLARVDASAEEAATRVARGEIVGWFQGGSELGPRALGYRSILADPQDRRIKDTLNERVKFREGFRPFAPAVLEERAHEIFAMAEGESLPFMQQIVEVREQYRELLPGVTHVDGTARVQTVSREENPLLHRLIEAYAEQRTLPVVVNTSFNLKGMPIVESPANALACFVMTEMDALVLGSHVVPMPDRGSWTPVADPTIRIEAEGRLGEIDLELRVRIGRRVLDRESFVLLRAMDGRRTVSELATRLEVEPRQMLRRVLEFMRRGWCRWSETPRGDR
jgi:carbamoyltransferase